MATRSDSDETLISLDEVAVDSPKIVSFPSVDDDSVGKISPKKQMNSSSPFAFVSGKDEETTQSDSVEVSSSETSSMFPKEPEAMNLECPVVFSVSETGSAFLEENRVREEQQQIKKTFDSDISKETDRFGVDGSVVSISETQGFVSDTKESSKSEKTEQDSETQRLLEAEKRRLLAEIELGAIFKKKDDVGMASGFQKIEKNGNGSKEQREKMERVRVKDNAFVGGSVKIEMVDDTALLNVVPFYKKGKDHPKRAGTTHTDKDAPRKHKKLGEKPVSEIQKRGETNGKPLKMTYSINQMKSMRYAQIANQKKLWSDMYGRLLPELVTEYESLVSMKNQKASKSNQSGIGILGTKEGIDDLTLEEEEEEEYIEDNDDYNSILRPAFEVDGEPDFDSGPPEDGLEYLRRVRWEAKQIPNVRVAKIDETKYVKKEQSVYMPQIPEIPKCPEHLLPVKEWEDALLSDFVNLRLALLQNASAHEEDIMSTCQSEEDALTEIFNKRLHTESDESFGVVISEIQGMDSVTRVSKLKKRICLVEKESCLESNDCKWLVALCASVDTPLDADTCACLRALLRKCASLRALEVEDEQVINRANMLITIAGRYFGQME